ncbi:ABC-type transport auxiliary lipoprotein family protein [Arcobacter cloacae]|uniref:Uncharacterized protein n=1 Tax=Arcobacter cloacae TaxID=1054034 RepID=A0A6M8NBY7_9BACT|nr:hypothetical protein [Arcobacter cloacae]QKF88695.1 putative lipid asymmetry ABC transporter MlaABCDEF component MlaB [Arcobacter cloacae]RXI41659.1 hypothetical protein CP963_06005 [Arcobacter cloacae]
MKNDILYKSKSSILFFLIFLLFTGCNLKQNSIDIDSYAILFKAKEFTENKKLDTIFIEEPNVNRSFNSNSIFYTTKPFLFEEYAKNKWINLPSSMIYNQLIDSFNTSRVFANVISRDSKIEHRYKLKSEIIKLYHSFEEEKSYAVLKVKFDLIEDKKIVKSFTYDKKVLCKSNNPYGFVESINKGFEESINDLLSNISKI